MLDTDDPTRCGKERFVVVLELNRKPQEIWCCGMEE